MQRALLGTIIYRIELHSKLCQEIHGFYTMQKIRKMNSNSREIVDYEPKDTRLKLKSLMLYYTAEFRNIKYFSTPNAQYKS